MIDTNGKIYWLHIYSQSDIDTLIEIAKDNNAEKGIWITNPLFIVNTNKKAEELIYYPLYNSKKIDQLKEKLPKAEHILIDTCDILPCPETDKTCNEKTSNLINSIKKDFTTIHHKKEGNCEQFIFKKTISLS